MSSPFGSPEPEDGGYIDLTGDDEARGLAGTGHGSPGEAGARDDEGNDKVCGPSDARHGSPGDAGAGDDEGNHAGEHALDDCGDEECKTRKVVLRGQIVAKDEELKQSRQESHDLQVTIRGLRDKVTQLEQKLNRPKIHQRVCFPTFISCIFTNKSQTWPRLLQTLILTGEGQYDKIHRQW